MSGENKRIVMVWFVVCAGIISFGIHMFMGNEGKKSVDQPPGGNSAPAGIVENLPGKEMPSPLPGQSAAIPDSASQNNQGAEGIGGERPSDGKALHFPPQDVSSPPPPENTGNKNSPAELPEDTRKAFQEEIGQLHFSIESAKRDMKNLDLRIDQLRKDLQLAEEAYHEAKDNFQSGKIDEATLNTKKEELEMWLRNVEGSKEMRDSKLVDIDHYRYRIEELERSLSRK